MRLSLRMCPNQRGEAGAPPNRNAAEDPLHESRDAHDCAPGRIGPRAAVACWRNHCVSSGCLRATPYAWYHDACVVGLSEKKPVRRVSLRSENAFRVGRMARFYPSGTGWKRPRPMGHPRGMIPPMRTWYAGHQLATSSTWPLAKSCAANATSVSKAAWLGHPSPKPAARARW